MTVKIATVAAALLVLASVSAAVARTRNDAPPRAPVAAPKDPLVVVVSLRRQKLTVYNRNGSVAESPISSGTAAHPTITGVFSVIGKAVEHYSNLYDDAPMPYMQRLTWTGTAMHAGHLPGYPASHGCIRMPMAFSKRLYDMTAINTRVVISNADVVPRPITHGKLFDPPVAEEAIASTNAIEGNPGISRVAALGGSIGGVAPRRADEVPLSAAASVRFAETQELWRAIGPLQTEHDAKLDTFKAAQKSLNLARLDLEKLNDRERDARAARARIDASRQRLEAELQSIGRRVEAAKSERAIEALIRAEEAAEEKLFDLARDLDEVNDALAEAESVRGDYDARIDAALELQSLAADALREAQQDLKDARSAYNLRKREDARYLRPVSVLISRKDQRLYVRQGFEPLLEVPVTIVEADLPIGTHVYTAMGYSDGLTKLDWSVMSLPPRDSDKQSRATLSAAEALDRIQIPEEAHAAIAERMKPGSSIIISDDGASQHTGEATDFTVATR